MAEIKRMDEMTPADYDAMGFKSGLEIHQQLDTKKKLFCRCPVRPYSEEFNAEILRHMRPTLSELGEYDGTALMEFKTKKEIIYQIHQETVCTYEMDDTPPFELNEQALDIALEITMLLNCNLVSELHIARKQYLDGSIPTGFQRTTILGVDGWIPYAGRKIRIRQLGLEEDACREVSDEGHVRTYRTDRLGIPLVETVTYADMKTPAEVADVAQIIRYLTRSTGKVKTGIGAAREDVNVSIEGGRRVEIKGVSRIPYIPLLVHNEAFRQRNLLEINAELTRRGITPESFAAETFDVTEILRDTRYYPITKALGKGLQVRAVVLKGYRGILSFRTQPETTFAKEISDRVRVIACLDRLPNIAHSDMEGDTLSSAEWTRIKKLARTGERDAVVIVWGDERDVEMGAGEITIRAKEALDGVPNETRQALPDGTTGFERILPGPDRMYPDTDLPPLAITEEQIERTRSILPEPPWKREERYRSLGLGEDLAGRMSIAREKDLFDRALEQTDFEPVKLAWLILGRLQWMRRKGKLPNFTDELFVEALTTADRQKLLDEALLPLVEKVCRPAPVAVEDAAAGFSQPAGGSFEHDIEKLCATVNPPPIPKEKLKRYLMRTVMETYRGRIRGREVAAAVDRYVSRAVKK
ncbi:MAG: Glu-tRNA(Gln) amidotransferase subunit GatE [bacterium]|nr:MAG: Glu-tRNA(Gln) amidotransferase subunit GatE [bacterium]